MLYRAYSNPLDWVSMSINRGRFGESVEGFLKAEYERRKEEIEKNNEWMLWVAYVHSYSNESFNNWKKHHCSADSTTKKNSDAELTDEGISEIIDRMFQG